MAGALAAVNPCGFPLLPAFLSFYVGAREPERPAAASRVAEGLAVGLLVSGGFFAAFAALGLPIAYGATLVADALPWAGIAIGAALATLGAASVLGPPLSLPSRAPFRAGRGRGASSVVLFGAGYGIASLGCTLPLFLALVAASTAADGGLATLAAFAAYGVGTGLVLTALSLAAALLKEGLARRLRRLLPQMHRIGGVLLLVAGAYVAYYWWRVHFGPSATLADDPLVGLVTRFTARVQALADDAGLLVVAAAAAVVVIGLALALRRSSRTSGSSSEAPVID